MTAVAAASHPHARAATEGEYLDTARATARYLLSVARDEGDRGLSWPVSDITPVRQTGIDAGAAGIGLFFLELFLATRETAHLVAAERASAFVFSEYRRRGPGGPDWLAGPAGAGEFALRLHRATGREVHLADARWAADWLVRNATREGDLAHWRFTSTPRIYTGRYHGAAGIGLFLLLAHEATGRPEYLDTARAAGRWLQQHVVRFGDDTIGWKRLTTDADAYHNWCGGSTGIMEFLARLADARGDAAYLDLYRRTAEGLLRHAQPQGEGVAWPYYSSPGSRSLPVVFCHGASSAAVTLYEAWRVLGDSRYLQAARRAATWTAAAGLQGESGRYWPHILNRDQFETGYQTGVASIGHAFLMMHAADPDARYVAEARQAAAYLMRIADVPAEGQVRWINYTNAERPDWKREYANGWYTGAAGIGIFFLELDAATRPGR